MTLRRFAFWNIWLAVAQMPAIAWWAMKYPASWSTWGVLYLSEFSIYTLVVAALSWWESKRLQDDALTVDELIAHTDIEPT